MTLPAVRFVIARSPNDHDTYRALCYSQDGEREAEHSYTDEELVAEIARLRRLRQPTAQHAAALNRLRCKNG